MKLDLMSDASTMDDARLVALGLVGDRDAFGQLVTRYQSPVCALAYSACGDLAQSQDCAQEAFIIAWRKLGDLKEPAKFKSWLFGIARNLINSTFRQQSRNPLADAEALDESLATPAALSNPAGLAISKEEEQILWRSLKQIPEIYREPLVLVYREHQSIENVAATLDLTEEAARQRLSRGRKLLQERVLAFVEGALGQTGPNQAFTLSVLAALPAMTISAKAATLSVAAKGGAAAKGAGLLGLAGAIVTPLLAFFAMWFDYRLRRKAGLSGRELSFLKVYYLGILIGAFVFVLACIVLMDHGRSLMKTSPALFAGLMISLILGYALVIGAFAWRYIRAAKKLAAEQTPVEATRKSPSPVWEYRSRFELFGLPFIHIRFGGWFGGRMEERFKAMKPLKAWITMTDGFAVGVLFAYGGTAIAPVSVGAVAIGLFSFGAFSIGGLAVGGFGFGIWALAMFAVGWEAFGDCAIAWNAARGGQFAVAHYFALAETARAAQANTELVRHVLSANPFFQFCQAKMTVARMILITWVWMIPMMCSQIIQGWITARKLRLNKRSSRSSLMSQFIYLAFIAGAVTLPAGAARADSVTDRITVTVRGQGPDVVLIPGLASSSAVWDATAAHLEGHYRLHVVQVAGFAASPARANAEGQILQPVVDAIDAYIKTNHLKAPKVIGHSLGGLAGMMLAVQHPGDVDKLMVVDALPFYSVLFGANDVAAATPQAASMRDSIIAESQDAYAQSEKQFLRSLVKSPEGRKAAIAWAVASDKSVVARAMYDDLTTDFRPKLPQLKAPVTVLYPFDPLTGFPQAAVDKLYQENFAALPNKTLVRIDGSFHFIMLDQPDAFAAQVDTFLK